MWFEILNIKMSVLSNYRVHGKKMIKILEIVLFCKNWQTDSKSDMENQRLLIARTILKIMSKYERVIVFYSRLKGLLQLSRHHGISISEY